MTRVNHGRGGSTARPPRLEQVLQEAALPAELEALVRRTVRRTRLRRRERRRVGRELAEDFRTRLDGGAAAETLRREFGAPRAAARRIRRDVRRRRRLADRVLVGGLRWTGKATALLFVVYAGAAVVLALLTPRVTFDPLDRLLAITPPAADPAWPSYRTSLAWHRSTRSEAVPLGAGSILRDEMADAADRAADRRAILARSAELAGLRAAAARPTLGWRPSRTLPPEDAAWFAEVPVVERFARSPEDSWPLAMPGVPLPFLGELRAAARLLATDARIAAEAGDGDRAAANLEAILGVARHAEEVPTLIGQVVASALRSLAADETIHLLETVPESLADADLESLATAFAATTAAATASKPLDLTMERVLFEDAVQRSFSGGGPGGGILLPRRAIEAAPPLAGEVPGAGPFGPQGVVDELLVAAVAPFLAVIVADRAETLDVGRRTFDLIEADAAKPVLERWKRPLHAVLGRGPGGRPSLRHPLAEVLTPLVRVTSRNRTLQQDRLDAAAVAIAAERWRRERGSWPDRLQDVVPSLLAGRPRDAWDGRPLRYRLDAAGPRLWSVGEDGTDDGGVQLHDPRTGRAIRLPGEPSDQVLLGPTMPVSGDRARP